MAKKRVTPPDDFDRFADNLWNRYGDKIEDIDSYNEYFDKYMEVETTPLTSEQDTELRRGGFESLTHKHPSIIKEHLPFKIVHREKEKVTELREKGKLREVEKFEGIARKKPQFTIVGFLNINSPKKGEKKGIKFVYSREITFEVKGKKRMRLIDRYGRYVGRIKNEPK